MVKEINCLILEILEIDKKIQRIFFEFFKRIISDQEFSLTEIQIYRNNISILSFFREDIEEELSSLLRIFLGDIQQN